MISGPGSGILPLNPAIRELPARQRPLPEDEAGRQSRSAEGGRSPEVQSRDRLVPGSAAEAERLTAEDAASELGARQRVESLASADQSRFRRQQEINELPLNNQQALAAYNQTASGATTSTSELVGVDIFV